MNARKPNWLLMIFAASMLAACGGGNSGLTRTVGVTVADLQADAGVRGATLSWTNPTGASSFNLYMSAARNCPIDNYTTCPAGALITNVTSPYTVDDLSNGQAYFFRLESVYADGARGLSNEAGARPNALTFNGEIRAAATGADGTVYVGGGFSKASVTTGSAIPLDAHTGRLARPDFAMVSGEVRAMAADGAGGWYVGGSFRNVGGVARNNLAHILADGTVDPNFHPNPNDVVYALAVSGGFVYAGGTFTSFAPTADTEQHQARLAAILADGAIDPDFHPVSFNDVRALLVSGSTLYIGSARHSIIVGSPADPYVIACNTLDAANQPGEILNWNPGVDDSVSALAVADGSVYVGGVFTAPRRRLAVIDALDGTKVDAKYPQGGRGISALAVAAGTLYVGGLDLALRASDGTTRNNFAAIGADGAVDERYTDTEGDVLAFAVAGDTLYVGSRSVVFNTGRRTASQLAAFNIVDGAKHAGERLDWNPNPNGDVLTLQIAGDTVLAGGNFHGLGGSTRNHLAALDANGMLLPWNPDADGTVLTLAVSANTIYMGGSFTTLGGTPRLRLGAVGTDGVVDANFHPDANQIVNRLVMSHGMLYAGGRFTTIGNEAHERLAAIRTDGTPDPSFHPVIDDGVTALAVAGSTLYVGGTFLSVEHGDTAHPNLVAYNTLDATTHPGELLPDWQPNVGGTVLALAATPNTVYVGSSFPQRSITAVDTANGTIDTNFPQSNGTVFELTWSDNTLFVGGAALGLEDRKGVMHHALAVIDANGVVDSRYPDADSFVTALTVSGGALHVGGYFSLIGDKVRGFLAELNANGAIE